MGQTANISCFGDILVDKIEWVYNGEVKASSNGQHVTLVFNVIEDFLHKRKYNCRAITPYGYLNRDVKIFVTGITLPCNLGSYVIQCSAVPDTALNVSIVSNGNPVAGELFQLVCIAEVKEGIYTTPILTWKNSTANGIMNDFDITVGPATANSLPFEFRTLRSSHAGEYTCEATLYSVALESPLILSSTVSVEVEGKHLHKIMYRYYNYNIL